jgi:hypothetical protein
MTKPDLAPPSSESVINGIKQDYAIGLGQLDESGIKPINQRDLNTIYEHRLEADALQGVNEEKMKRLESRR